MRPFVKWAGGKRQILDRINAYIDDSVMKGTEFTYIEPFLGGGAVFFDRSPNRAVINDLNEDLINAYRMIKSDKYNAVITVLKDYANEYQKDKDGFYYDIRSWDRDEGWPNNHTDVERAARMIFLNRTCYNGLYRVNSKGQFNTPIGRYKNPTICDEALLTEIHNYLSDEKNDIDIMQGSYIDAISKAKDGDVVYIDPPYDYEDDDGFTKYQMEGFTFDDFVELKKECDKAINKGAYVIISNNATTKVIDLFQQDPHYIIKYDIDKFTTLRNINCNGERRKTGKEAIIWGVPSVLPQANDMKKIIKLMMADDSVLIDRNYAMQVIDVTTARQVAYYMAALMYLNYITHDNKFTVKAQNLNKDHSLIAKDIYNQLINDRYVSPAYNYFKENGILNTDIIKDIIKKDSSKLAESTLKRRASTIKAWVDWMFSL